MNDEDTICLRRNIEIIYCRVYVLIKYCVSAITSQGRKLCAVCDCVLGCCSCLEVLENSSPFFCSGFM